VSKDVDNIEANCRRGEAGSDECEVWTVLIFLLWSRAASDAVTGVPVMILKASESLPPISAALSLKRQRRRPREARIDRTRHLQPGCNLRLALPTKLVKNACAQAAIVMDTLREP
jgi:hypothetical protein